MTQALSLLYAGILFTVLLFPGAKTGSLSGTVTDQDGRPIEGAVLEIVELCRRVVTGPDGRYEMPHLVAGSYTVKLLYVGVDEQVENVAIQGGKDSEQDFTLTIEMGDPTEYFNPGDSPSGEWPDLSSVEVRDREAILNSARAITNGLVALDAKVQTDGVNGYIIRGARASETSMRIDGAEVDDQFANVSGIYPSPTVAESSTMAGSGYSAEYGDVLSGVVNTTARSQTSPGPWSNEALSNSMLMQTTTVDDIGPGAVGSSEIINNSITVEDIGRSAVGSDEIINNSITVDDIGTAAAKDVNDGGVKTIDISNTAVTSSKIPDKADAPVTGNQNPQQVVEVEEPQVVVPPPPPVHENAFRTTSASPLSTFSIDVDKASYANVRGHLRRGTLPPPDAVRIEELVNYFRYDYPEPKGEHPFSFATETATCPWDERHLLVRVALKGKNVEFNEKAPPSNLVFLIDVSGSMGYPNKLELLKQSFRLLVEQLRPQDRVSIVTYAGAAGLVLDATPGSDKCTILESLDRLQSGGSTAGGEGIVLAYNTAKKHFMANGNNRVLLATDGDFNVGVSSQEALVSLIEEKRKEGVYLSVLGFGYGNYQDGKMEQLADNGNGVCYFVDDLKEGERVLVGELSGTLFTIAKDVKLQIEFNPKRVAAYRLIGYENRVMAARDFANDAKDAGELGAGHTVTALYEVVPIGSDVGHEIEETDSADYQLAGEAHPELMSSNDLMLARLRYKLPADTASKLIEHMVKEDHADLGLASDDFRFAAAVAEWGLLLKGSKYRGSASFDHAIATANSALGADADGYRAEFVKLVEATKGMVGSAPGVSVR